MISDNDWRSIPCLSLLSMNINNVNSNLVIHLKMHVSSQKKWNFCTKMSSGGEKSLGSSVRQHAEYSAPNKHFLSKGV